MIWIWSKLSAVKWMDAWEERFYGNENAVITLLKGGASLRIEVYLETELEALELKEYWGGSVRKIVNEDWVAKSTKVKPPLKIRDQIVVTMEGEGEALEALRKQYHDRMVISIPPEMAFGTGDHPTTANCLRLLLDESEKRANESWKALDLGTGSALLAIAAAQLGAEKVLGMDYDEAAVTVAKRNCDRNLSAKGHTASKKAIQIEAGDVFSWEPKERYEVVIANLFSDILIEAMPRIEKWIAEGGTVILSGILNEQWPRVQTAGEEVGLNFEEPIQRGKWTTARGRRS